MVMSVTPMVCVTLALGLGYSDLILTGCCCARTYGAAHVAAKRIAKAKNENRLRKIIFGTPSSENSGLALCNAGGVNGKRGRNWGQTDVPAAMEVAIMRALS